MKAELQAQLEEVADERSKLNVEKQQIHMEEQRVIAKYVICDVYVGISTALNLFDES